MSEAAKPGDATGGELLSFLALEGANPALKLKMLASTSRAERLATATSELERQPVRISKVEGRSVLRLFRRRFLDARRGEAEIRLSQERAESVATRPRSSIREY